MHKKRFFLGILVLLLSGGLLFAAGAKEQQPIKMRTSTNLAPGGTVGRALKKFV